MKEGLYGLDFGASSGTSGYGVCLFQGGTIIGGDASFVYTGTYTLNDGKLTVQLRVKNDRSDDATLLFLDYFDLTLVGENNEGDEVILTGYMEGNKKVTITVTAHLRHAT